MGNETIMLLFIVVYFAVFVVVVIVVVTYLFSICSCNFIASFTLSERFLLAFPGSL